MCVVVCVPDDKRRPSEAQIEAFWDANGDGAGIAWREKEGLNKWLKGLDLATIKQLIARTKTPFIAHFRIASIGGVHSSLTHPFPITEDVDLSLEGEGDFPLLFHNGTWHEWRKDTWECAGSMGYRIPDGKWSDTRALALIAHHYGFGALEMIDQKVAVLRPRGSRVISLYGGPWHPHTDSFTTSNNFWVDKVKKFIVRDLRPIKSAGADASKEEHPAPTVGRLALAGPALVAAGRAQTQSIPFTTAGTKPVEVKSERTALTLVREGGGPAAVAPFVQPLNFYEKRHTEHLITHKGIVKIRKYFSRRQRHPNSMPPQELLLNTPIEQKIH